MPESLLLRMLQVVWTEVANMWWFFVLACLLVGFIKGYKLDLKIRDLLRRSGFWGVVLAVLGGLVSPLCACGILPGAISLAMVGTPLAPLIALLVTSPVMGPDALVLTWSALGTEWAVLKLVGATFLGLSVGCIVLLLEKQGYLAGPQVRLKPIYNPDGTLAPAKTIGAAAGIRVKNMVIIPRDSRLHFILDRTLDAAWFTGRFLLLAIVLEAIIVTLVPPSWILGLVGADSLGSVLVAALVGLPLPVNQIPLIPILAGLLQRGMDHGAALTLLLAGPVSSIPAMAALYGLFRPRVVVIFLVASLGVSILLGALWQVAG